MDQGGVLFAGLPVLWRQHVRFFHSFFSFKPSHLHHLGSLKHVYTKKRATLGNHLQNRIKNVKKFRLYNIGSKYRETRVGFLRMKKLERVQNMSPLSQTMVVHDYQ
jgi:hypothetical protein